MHANPPTSCPVVVVGGGPAGLMTACELLRRDVPVRVLDARPGPSQHSKALLLWPRTLDVLADMSLEQPARERGVLLDRFTYYSTGRPVLRLDFDPTTVPLCLPQRHTEEVLTAELHRLGGAVEWGGEVVDVQPAPDGVRVGVRDRDDGTVSTLDAGWLVGADGAHSTVRDRLGIDFLGDTYPSTFMLVDAVAAGKRLAPDEAHYFQSPGGILVVVALPQGRHRFFVNAPPDEPIATLELLQRLVDERGPGGVTLTEPNWLSTFRVHRRAATAMRSGRCFLVGDAAHVHSPAGGQGLNTGLQDAHNLAWKLAAVSSGRAAEDLLDSYQDERLGVARQVVRDTDVQTRAWLLTTPWRIRMRDAALRAGDASGLLRRYLAPVMAGRRLSYPDTSTAVEPAPRSCALRPGTGRVGTAPSREVLDALGRDGSGGGWLLATVSPSAPDALAGAADAVARRWPVLSRSHVDTSRVDRARAGTLRGLGCRRGFYLVRPDGFVAAHGHGRGDLTRVDALMSRLCPPAGQPAVPVTAGSTEPDGRRAP